jgi:hypothetical protein
MKYQKTIFCVVMACIVAVPLAMLWGDIKECIDGVPAGVVEAAQPQGGRVTASHLNVTGRAQFFGPISYGFGTRSTETLAADFSLSVDAPLIEVTSTTGVTSSATAAIADPSNLNGYQVTTILNGGTNSIVFQDAANTDLGGSDITLGANDVLSVVFDGTEWVRLFSTDN